MALLAVLLAVACSSGPDGAAPARTPEKPHLKLGILPVLGAAPAFLAQESNFFRDAGLQVEFVTIQGAGAAMDSLAKGDLDMVFGNYVSFFTTQAKGTTSIKFVADGYFAQPRTWMVLVPKDSKLHKPADLSGKRVAVTTTSSLADLTIKAVLSTTGSQIQPLSFSEMSYTDMGTALTNHTVDAALLSEPYITDVAKKTGAIPLFDAASGPTADMPISGYSTTEKFASANPNTIAAFQQALSRGAEIAGTDRGRVEQVIHKFAGVDEQTAALCTLVGYPTRMDPRRLQRVPDLMSAYGLLKTRIDAQSMILPSAMGDQVSAG
ncbi:ABC transporter substrate-binding protein [Actinocrispum sp. NPDC049592]|uniref:ABC transporter substrate-binding protein n=1 Tax=Actinocrispum sp. NPDC049592 TaxID=3154835 RepID=UPI00341AA4C6